MLVEFRVKNHRSIREEQAISFEAAAPHDETGLARRPFEKGPLLLPALALYGANASGKSNVLAALAAMREAVLFSHRLWEPLSGVQREPFGWGASRSEPSLFEAIFLVDGVRHEYGFTADDERFLEEWLYAYPKGRKQLWFAREGQTLKFGEQLHGDNAVVEKATRENALFLSTAAQFNHGQLTPVFQWFANQRFIGLKKGAPTRSLPPSWSLTHDAAGETPTPPKAQAQRSAAFNLLQEADLGLVDVRVEISEEPYPFDPSRIRRRPRILFRHHPDDEDSWLPLEEESHGTQTLYRLAPAVLNALETGALLVIDELEAGLHPLLAMKLVALFNNPSSNPRLAQLLFTTHDTNLLGHVPDAPSLRRDQVWLTEKDEQGATTLYPLSEYKPRKGENLERGYLQGRYGAIPFLGDLVREPSE